MRPHMPSASQDDIRLAGLFSSIVKELLKIKHGGHVDAKYINEKLSEIQRIIT